ncbi:MAG: hypothetical protein KatS3mg101_0943 [Patescibacteria group bacterium]|nr:MAG: hypothetical protein KatS3mg101_0943 [Patescibacteria group bacterium]
MRTRKDTIELVEILAELEHEQWKAWADHFLDKVYRQNPPDYESIKRWERQIETPYKKLTEEEKDKDREWAWKILKKLLLVSDRNGNVWVNTDKPVNVSLLKKIIKCVESLLNY